MTHRLFTVLVADDEYWIRENLRALIDWEAYGMEFLPPAADGEEALLRMRENKADILITDINMPYMSGLELIEQVREAYPDTVIAVLSGYNDFEYVRKALVGGAIDYLLKPVAKAKLMDVLLRAIDAVMEKQQAHQARQQTRARLEQAASVMLDRDISQLLHETKHRTSSAASVGAALFEYEQRFSSYRLMLVKTASLHRLLERGVGADMQSVVFRIKQCLEAAPLAGQQLVIHNLYHANHFLLIAQADEAQLRETVPDLLEGISRLTGHSVQAVASAVHLSLGELRKAYDEARTALLALPCNAQNAFLFAQGSMPREESPRLTPEMLKQMELYAKLQQREGFHQVVRQTGLFRCKEEAWRTLDVLHTLNSIAWVLRRQAEQSGSLEQTLVLDNLMELLLGSAEHIEPDEIRDVLAQMEDEYFSAAPPAQSDTMKATVRLVKAYIDQHYFEDISLGSLSEQFSVDASYLSKGFKQATGTNLMLYIAQARVARAKALLAASAQPITEIAQLVGYDDYAYFSRVFKKLEGSSPRKHREKYQR